MRYMYSAAPPLLPIFRSEAQARILAWLLLDPSREQPIASLADVGGVTQPSALREVNRLIEAGLLTERRAGNTRLVKANLNSPYHLPLVQILARTFGPLHLVPAELSKVEGVVQAFIVGSWAARIQGAMGDQPRDIDVVVVGNPNRRSLRRANARLEERIGLPVQITTVTTEEWAEHSTGFLRDISTKPMIQVVPGDER